MTFMMRVDKIMPTYKIVAGKQTFDFPKTFGGILQYPKRSKTNNPPRPQRDNMSKLVFTQIIAHEDIYYFSYRILSKQAQSANKSLDLAVHAYKIRTARHRPLVIISTMISMKLDNSNDTLPCSY